jgi:hypothetical protein
MTLQKAKEEIFGAENLPHSDQLETLILHLGARFADSSDRAMLPARIAPSPITRSEAELLGLSAPRFAIRVFVSDGGFINCRRLDALAESFQYDGHNEWGMRDRNLPEERRHPEFGPEIVEANDYPRWLKDAIQESVPTCIADCLLSPPPRMRDREYRFLNADLFAAYGEQCPIGEAGPFTPFCRSFPLGGGLCAQAVCFMGTALLAKHATGIYGPAEVTVLAHPRQLGELALTGMTAENMASYFDGVNLRLTQQAVHFDGTGDAPPLLGMAIRAYLRSGMPVAFPTDMRALATKRVGGARPVYAQNHIDYKRNLCEGIRNTAHAVILIGFHETRDLFIFHDPGAFPYLEINLAQLSDLGASAEDAPNRPEKAMIMPITPRGVRLPLLAERRPNPSPTGGYSLRRGLRRLVADLRGELLDTNPLDPVWLQQLRALAGRRVENGVAPAILRPLTDLRGTEFLLVRGQVAYEDLRLLPLQHRLPFANRLAECLRDLDWEDHWIWLECHPGCALLWDAEQEPPSEEVMKTTSVAAIARILRAVIYLDADSVGTLKVG